MAVKLIALVTALLLLAGCGPGGPAPSSDELSRDEPAASPPLPSPPEEDASREEPIDPPLSCVEDLAAQTAARLGLGRLEGEARVRAAYRYLIESVYFANPVGLDTWRYLCDREEPIPYLENRALSPLLFQIGSCEDFAAAMVLLLRAAGFEAEYVAGYTLSVEQEYVDHAWAVVRLDGLWYHLDPQLEQNVSRQNRLTWRYYLKSDQELERDHKWGENLIEFAGDLTQAQIDAIRENHTPPLCPISGPSPDPIVIPLPARPSLTEVENRIAQIKRESGKGELPELPLNVEPPVLVPRLHVTPPLRP